MLTASSWLDAAALAAMVTFAMQVVKPLVELVVKPSNPAHDAILRLMVFLLNVGGIVLLAANAHALSLASAPSYAVQALLQSIGSHALYATAIDGKADVPAAGA